MRHLVWLLLLANLGMFVWLLTQPEPQHAQYRPVPVPPGIEPLVLVSERSAHRAGGKGAAAQAEPADTPVETSDSAAAADQLAEAPAVVADVSALAEAPQEDKPADESAEHPGGSDAGKPAAVAPEPVCQAIGPFMKQADAGDINDRLAQLGYRPSLRSGEVRNPAGYWVYMPAMPAAEARRIVAELDKHGMTDYFVGKQNYISLGIFSGKSKAQLRLEQIESLGFDATLDQRFRTRTVYWIDLAQGDGTLLGSEAWSEIQAQHADIRVQSISCE